MYGLAPAGTQVVVASLVAVFALTALLAFLLPSTVGSAAVVYYLYFVFVIVPLINLYSLQDQFASLTFVISVIIGFFLSVVLYRLAPEIRIPKLDRALLRLSIGLAFLVTGIVFLLLLRIGGGAINFDLRDVYDIRGQLADRLPLFMRYLIPWQGYVLNMFFLVFFLERRKWLPVAGVITAQMLFFGLTNYKSFLLAPALVLLLYYMKKNQWLLSLFSLSVAVLPGLVLLAHFLFNDPLIGSLLIRRLFYVPAVNHFFYYHFFSQPENPHLLLSSSIMRGFIEYPYDLPVTRLISWTYYGRDLGANVGFMADAFAQFGHFGIIAAAVLLALLCKLVDHAASGLRPNVATAIIAVPAMALVNSGLLTTILTHGFGVALLFIWLLSSQEEVFGSKGEKGLTTERDRPPEPGGPTPRGAVRDGNRSGRPSAGEA